ncbi:MAG: hypothetical protein HUN04_14935 [Desulfobacter sp.]|nr:MAG: hypothetical protein HUN04_14935 [Desulfobacter sp.]
MICPYCRREQEDSFICKDCGIDINGYLKTHPEREADFYQSLGAKTRVPAFPLKSIVNIILLAGVVFFILGFFLKDRLPEVSQILPATLQDPVQIETDSPPFEKQVDGITYTITPLYRYELNGMVVSYNHSAAFYDFYHKWWNDFINIKDICVLWGENLKSDVYQHLEFSSGSFTCYYRWPNREIGKRFNCDCLSNNHLLSDTPAVNQAIMGAGIGDQIHLKGYLVRYSHANGTFKRSSSTTRTDKGNGACETIYVEAFKNLKPANPFWKKAYHFSGYAILICLALLAAFFVREILPPRHGA